MEVTLQNLTKKFGAVTAVSDLSLSFRDGKLTGLLGPSGCGKSTTLYMIAGLEDATSGSILFGGRDVTTLMPEKRNIGLVFQNYALYPHMTVEENIEFPLTSMPNLDTGKKYTKQERRSAANAIAKLVQIESFLDRKPSQLSGGQQQRVAIARALVKRPDVLLLDEPLSNLDARLRMEMRAEIRRIQTESKVTTIFVTHDQEEAMSITDEIVLMRSGVVQQVADPHEMYRAPRNRFVASFLGNPPISLLDVTIEGGQAKLPGGQLVPASGIRDGRALMGIRPEAWAVGGSIAATIGEVELRGQDQVVTFCLGQTPVRAILNADEAVRAGCELGLSLHANRCHFFDPETEKRL